MVILRISLKSKLTSIKKGELMQKIKYFKYVNRTFMTMSF